MKNAKKKTLVTRDLNSAVNIRRLACDWICGFWCGFAHTRSLHIKDMLPLSRPLWAVGRKGGGDGEKDQGAAAFITKETNWTFSIHEYILGWGQIHLTGPPQHGEKIAQNCRNEIVMASITDMWISLVDDVEHGPINAQEIMDTFRTKNIDVYRMMDEDLFLDLPRAGKVF